MSIPAAYDFKYVSDEKRLDFLPKIFVDEFACCENVVYTLFSRYCKKYQGGYWQYVEVFDQDTGEIKARFMEPSGKTSYYLDNPDNYKAFELSPRGAGLFITYMTLSRANSNIFYAMIQIEDKEDATAKANYEKLSDLNEIFYHKIEALRSVIMASDEAGKILRLLD